MSSESERSLVPEFDKWDVKEVKQTAMRSVFHALKHGGIRGLAVVSTIIGLVWIAGQVITSTLDGGMKALCVLGIGLTLLPVALVSLLTEKENKNHATAKYKGGRVSQDQPGAQSNDQGPTRPATEGNGRALNGRVH